MGQRRLGRFAGTSQC